MLCHWLLYHIYWSRSIFDLAVQPARRIHIMNIKCLNLNHMSKNIGIEITSKMSGNPIDFVDN